MAFIWSGAIYTSASRKNPPLKILSAGNGGIKFVVSSVLSQGIIEACKGTPYFRFGVDIIGHKVGLMFQGQEADAWRKPRISKSGQIYATLDLKPFNTTMEELRGIYCDFHFDKNDQFWTADIRKRQTIKGGRQC